MSVTVKWLGHASFRISDGTTTVYIDPWKLSEEPHDATAVLVSHSHFDHYSAGDIVKVEGHGTILIGPADIIAQQGGGKVIKPGLSVDLPGGGVTAVAAYNNPPKQYHPQSENCLGFILEIGSRRIYYAGDTDMIEEMRLLSDIDLTLLPVGGTYTMNAEEASQAVKQFKPGQAIPYHWGDIVGSRKDAEKFAQTAQCEVTVLNPGESITI